MQVERIAAVEWDVAGLKAAVEAWPAEMRGQVSVECDRCIGGALARADLVDVRVRLHRAPHNHIQADMTWFQV